MIFANPQELVAIFDQQADRQDIQTLATSQGCLVLVGLCSFPLYFLETCRGVLWMCDEVNSGWDVEALLRTTALYERILGKVPADTDCPLKIYVYPPPEILGPKGDVLSPMALLHDSSKPYLMLGLKQPCFGDFSLVPEFSHVFVRHGTGRIAVCTSAQAVEKYNVFLQSCYVTFIISDPRCLAACHSSVSVLRQQVFFFPCYVCTQPLKLKTE